MYCKKHYNKGWKKIGVAYKIPVKIGYENDNLYELKSFSLKKNEWIVIEGQLNLSDGDKVEIVKVKK